MFPILNPPLSSLPIPYLWVVPVHQPQASSIVHRTWTGDSFHIWYYTYFNAILPNHPTLSLSLIAFSDALPTPKFFCTDHVNKLAQLWHRMLEGYADFKYADFVLFVENIALFYCMAFFRKRSSLWIPTDRGRHCPDIPTDWISTQE